MKRKSNYLFLFLLAILFSCSKLEDTPTPTQVDDDLDGPIGRPSSGYGSVGKYEVAKLTFQSPENKSKNVEIYYPKGASTPLPTIFYSHAFGGSESTNITSLLEWVAKKGYVIVYSPYPTLGVTVDERYSILWSSFKKAAADYPNLIDKTRVGFVGHSFGGGASFGLAYKGFVEEGWGQNARFIYTMAQWYSYQITNTQLMNFPANTKLIVQVYDQDVVNDHRMAIDLFKNITIADSEKDFIVLKSTTLPTYTYTTGHDVPNDNAIDAYDYYGIYRLLDALMDYSINNNAAAKKVALGNGSTEQITMPSYNGQALTPLEVTDNPTVKYPQDKYLYSCGDSQNPRISECK
jgi:hypothetical protein